jgi:hypothetical protein
MKILAGAVSEAVVNEYGHDKLLERLADPCWFQAFGCVLGFDWHSSGVTTTVCGALKEGVKDIGIHVCGGKGTVSRKTPDEIEAKIKGTNLDPEKLVYASRMAAKVDSNCIQDNYYLYHHCFVFSDSGKWAVVQQGMNNRYARRYHWFAANNFLNEAEKICCNKKEDRVLNLVSRKSEDVRGASVTAVQEFKELRMPEGHWISAEVTKRVMSQLRNVYELQPQNYEELVALKGVGSKTLRALALISKLIYGAELDWNDPVKFSYSHGGKDGTPFSVQRQTYDESIRVLKEAIENAKLGFRDKEKAIKRLGSFI